MKSIDRVLLANVVWVLLLIFPHTSWTLPQGVAPNTVGCTGIGEPLRSWGNEGSIEFSAGTIFGPAESYISAHPTALTVAQGDGALFLAGHAQKYTLQHVEPEYGFFIAKLKRNGSIDFSYNQGKGYRFVRVPEVKTDSTVSGWRNVPSGSIISVHGITAESNESSSRVLLQGWVLTPQNSDRQHRIESTFSFDDRLISDTLPRTSFPPKDVFPLINWQPYSEPGDSSKTWFPLNSLLTFSTPPSSYALVSNLYTTTPGQEPIAGPNNRSRTLGQQVLSLDPWAVKPESVLMVSSYDYRDQALPIKVESISAATGASNWTSSIPFFEEFYATKIEHVGDSYYLTGLSTAADPYQAYTVGNVFRFNSQGVLDTQFSPDRSNARWKIDRTKNYGFIPYPNVSSVIPQHFYTEPAPQGGAGSNSYKRLLVFNESYGGPIPNNSISIYDIGSHERVFDHHLTIPNSQQNSIGYVTLARRQVATQPRPEILTAVDQNGSEPVLYSLWVQGPTTENVPNVGSKSYVMKSCLYGNSPVVPTATPVPPTPTVSPTSTPTLNPTVVPPMCTPPACSSPNSIVCASTSCPGGCGSICATPTPTVTPTRTVAPPVCTPPACSSPNSIVCASASCPGGCGSICATPTPSAPTPSWHNRAMPCDVTGDGQVTQADANAVTNFINQNAGGVALSSMTGNPPPYYNVNNDGWINPLDVLTVINCLPTATPSPTVTPTRTPTPATGIVTQISASGRALHRMPQRDWDTLFNLRVTVSGSPISAGTFYFDCKVGGNYATVASRTLSNFTSQDINDVRASLTDEHLKSDPKFDAAQCRARFVHQAQASQNREVAFTVAMPNHKVFVTSNRYDVSQLGAFPAGPEQLCKTVATSSTFSASLNKNWRTILAGRTASGLAVNPSVVLPITKPIFDLAGNRIAHNAQDFWAGTLIKNIDRTEFGLMARGLGYVWTGALSNGTVDTRAASQGTCLNWSTSQAQSSATGGVYGLNNLNWITGYTFACSSRARLYCISD